MTALLRLVQTFGPARLAAMGAVTAILTGIFGFLIAEVNTPQMVPLYSDLSFDDSAAIAGELEAAGVVFEMRGEGATILVARDQVFRVRMQLADAGLPTGGSVGYEIFDQSDTLGATRFVQNINHIRALEGELSRTIKTIRQVSAARVHLVIPERRVFQGDDVPPSASIVLKIRGSLEMAQVRAIQHLVAAAVEGLMPGHISIVDESGRLLASGAGESGASAISGALQEQTSLVENRLRGQIEQIVDSIVGPGRSRIRVAAELDFNRVTETSENFDPNGQVVRSTQSREDSSNARSIEQGVTASAQLPGGGQPEPGAGEEEQTASSEEIVNYEISKSTRTLVTEAGRVKRLSVAVLVDGTYSADEAGNPAYAPRSGEELERIALLVRTAIGFDETRGDSVEVVNLRFASGPISDMGAEESDLFAFNNHDIMQLIELAVLAVIVLVLVFLVIRPLMKRIFAPLEMEQQARMEALAGQAAGSGDGSAERALLDQARPESGLPGGAGEGADEAGSEIPRIEWLEKAKEAGLLRNVTLQQVGEMVNENPGEAANVIRSWMKEAA